MVAHEDGLPENDHLRQYEKMKKGVIYMYRAFRDIRHHVEFGNLRRTGNSTTTHGAGLELMEVLDPLLVWVFRREVDFIGCAGYSYCHG